MRRLLVAVFLLAAVACDDATAPPPATANTQYVTVWRPWRPGERDSLVARLQRTHQLTVPYVGDLSDNAGLILPTDSVADIVANPDYVPPVAASPFGPVYSVHGIQTPGTGWTTLGLDIQIVNNNQGGDTFNWLGALWFNQSDSTWKGIILAATANNTIGATAVNTTTFDNANAKSGVGAGEARASDGTFWQANGTGSPNTFSVNNSFFFGASTVTSGPYLGGTSAVGLMNVTLNNIGLTRVLGAGTPATQTASLSGWIWGTRFTCVFPTPCTTNVPAVAQAALLGVLPDSLTSRLPWETTFADWEATLR